MTGFAGGLDRLVAQGLRIGATVGYQNGNQWVGGFSGSGNSNTFQAGLYANYSEGKVYADAVAGYSHSANQMWRSIVIPGLAPRTAYGLTGANQVYGQVETGYRFDLGGLAEAFVTPSPAAAAGLYRHPERLHGDGGGIAQLLGGAADDELAAHGAGRPARRLDGPGLARPPRHEGAAGLEPRVCRHGAAGDGLVCRGAGRPLHDLRRGVPQRDGVVLGLAATTAVAEAMSVYARYEGEVSGQDNAHAFTAGVRMTW